MNLHVKLPEQPNEAKLRYKAMDFEQISPGEFVRCAVTGRPIATTELKYWSVARQEAYASAAISWAREREQSKG